jgi:hypothetical protein
MRTLQKIQWGMVLLLMLGAAAAAQKQARATRVLVDPWTGARWLLAVNPAHPGGPGVLVADGSPASSVPTAQPAIVAPPPAVIRAGDRLTVEESTPVLTARYSAVALVPAALGDTFLARLTVGAAPVRVVALGPGRARLAAAVIPEARP